MTSSSMEAAVPAMGTTLLPLMSCTVALVIDMYACIMFLKKLGRDLIRLRSYAVRVRNTVVEFIMVKSPPLSVTELGGEDLSFCKVT